MKILILEDNPCRISAFYKKLIGHDVIAVETVGEAISLLESDPFDVLFMDHDLGGEFYVDSSGNEETGYTLACWLSDNMECAPKKIYVHSLNPVGVKNIQSVLPRAVHVPFAWMREDA